MTESRSRTATFSELVGDNLLEIGAGRPRSVSSNLPILRVADVLDGKIGPSPQNYAPGNHPPATASKVSKPGDVVLTIKGTVGRVAIMPADGPIFAYSPQLYYFRPAMNGPLRPRYLYYWFKSAEFWTQANPLKSQTDMADFLSLSDVQSLSIRIPPLKQQAGIADLLGALDDKIAVNERIAATSRELGLILFAQALLGEDPFEAPVESVASTLTRGVAPKYSESPDDLIVLNQKCVRGGRVNLEPSRLTLREKVKAPKLLLPNDVLVNSTGVGTLGRVARWTRGIDATVDSHITIVRFDASKVDPICAGFAMLQAQPEIEALGEGSTGQTELSRGQLGALEITLPSPAQQRELRKKLDSLEERADHAIAESAALATLRDALLPQLMSGRLRVKDAEKIVEDAT
ncbi:restriction endonuclease subunit S [Microbispora bryophytorum]|uniref:restriction endonuclease subunit S n=1 Tax=Microbispora bryophytorum TaxID=1460882 RepID=UPI00371DE25A